MLEFRKIISALTLIVVSSTLFIGCTKSEEKISKNTIVIWANLLENEVTDVKNIADKWSKENNIPVVVYKKQTTGKDFIETDNRAKPDIFLGVSAEDVGKLHKAKAVEEVPESIFPKDQYASNDLVQATSISGVQYGVPISQETVLLYYNKDLVKKVPQTMEELLDDAKIKGFSFANADYYFSFGIIASQGGYIFKYNNGAFDSNDIGLNNEGAIKGYKYLQDIYKNNSKLLPAATDMNASGSFTSKKSAYYIGEAGRVRTFNNAGVNFGIATIPTVNGKEVTPFKKVRMATVSSISTKKDKAWDLVKTLTEGLDEKFIEKGPYAPTYKKSLDTDTYKNSKYSETLLEQCNKAMILPDNVENGSITMVMPGYLEDLVMGKITPEECGNGMEKDLKKAIKQVFNY